MKKNGVILCVFFLLTACTFNPQPLSVDERYQQALKDVNQLFAEQKNISQRIDFYEALARGLKYNLDYRIKLVNTALQSGQLSVAEFTMFPALNVSGSVYTRNNDYATFGITPDGQITDVLNSTPRTLRSARVALSWNILDFGLGYVRAKQQGERVLIAEEEARKQVQQLTQDVLIAYWSAYSAQQLMRETKDFQTLLEQARKRLAAGMLDKTVPKENLLNYQAALLDGNRRIAQLRYKYEKALLDLKRLLNIEPDSELILAPPPLALTRAQNLENLDFKKVDAVTLVVRPELRGQNYQKRIAEYGVKTAILQALPGITLNEGWNYNSNKFLINRLWIDKSMDVAWNLLNLVSLPTTYKTAKIQEKYEKLKLLALTLTVLTETRYAYWHYYTISSEYLIARKQTETATALYQLAHHRQLASLASTQQVILAKLRMLTAQMDQDLLLADMSTALGELYLSMGSDILPMQYTDEPVDKLAKAIKEKFALQNTLDFKRYVDLNYEKLFGTQKTYTVQLMGSYSLDHIKKAQACLKMQDSTKYAKTKNQGKDWYTLTYGKYTTVAEAKSSLVKLPLPVREMQPWIRPMDGLQEY